MEHIVPGQNGTSMSAKPRFPFEIRAVAFLDILGFFRSNQASRNKFIEAKHTFWTDVQYL